MKKPPYIKLKRPGYTRKYKVNSEIFLREDATSFYLLGAYMTDGCISGLKTSITSKDKNWMEAIRRIVCSLKPLEKRKSVRAYNFVFSDVDSANWLMSYGCVPRKSKTLSLFKKIPLQYVPDFIRGMIDGDGSISIFKARGRKTKTVGVYLCSASKKIIDQIENLIPTNMKYHRYTRAPSKKIGRKLDCTTIIETCNQYTIKFMDIQAQGFLRWIYYPGHILSLPRKKKLAQKAVKHSFSRQGKLSETTVAAIRKDYLAGMTQKELSVKWGRLQNNISRIVRGEYYPT